MSAMNILKLGHWVIRKWIFSEELKLYKVILV